MRTLPLFAAIFAMSAALRGDSVPLHASVGADADAGTLPVALEAPSPDDWVTFDRLDLVLAIPADAPANLQSLAQVEDWDGLWYQTLLPDNVTPGETNAVAVDVSPDACCWESIGHPGAWHRRVLLRPNAVRLVLFANGAVCTSAVEVVSATALRSADTTPPILRNVRSVPREVEPAQGQSQPGVFGRYELRFDLPDRYANPFDPEEIAVDAEIGTPSGAVVTVPCFYYQDCVRVFAAASERILPQGRPEWRLRYSPAEPGEHSVALVARDRFGTNRLDAAASFTAAPAEPGALRPIRVSAAAPHFFEDTDGTPFYPVGFNIRSPFDSRMDERFPSRIRHPEGSSSYARRFTAMREAGLTFAEIWSSAWCMGLEWTPKFPGYHGIGQLNLLHAWDRDRVFEMAVENRIRINLVLNNHGRLSSFCDPEWQDNPWNAANGGPFQHPMQWFSDERAQRDFEAILRYEIARYGWNANLFAWEIWSELDLVGDGNGSPQQNPAVLAWHQRMAAYLHAHDPMRHLVSTHTCTDYTRMVPELANTPGLDHVCVDAYHGSNDPMHIVGLMALTGQQPHLNCRPCLITEFGGTPNAAGVEHLRREVRASLWSSLPCGLSGAPAFWWWHIVEEYDFYPMYAAYVRFLQNEDFRTPAFLRTGEFAPLTKPAPATPDAPQPPDAWRVLSVAPDLAYAWIVVAGVNTDADPADRPRLEGYRLAFDVPEWDGAVFTAEFWDTDRGQPVRSVDVRVRDSHVDIPVPAFSDNIAVKIHRTR